jgi:phosphoesterase RecJ-like protein
VAVYTDTGGFRYPGTTPGTHALAGRLLEAGVDPQKVYTEIFERQTPRRLKLTGEVLSTLQVSPGGRVAWLQVRQGMVDRLDATWEDADDLVNFTLQIDGVVAGFYFKELEGGLTKVSCRSRGDFAIDRFVGRWGGGGHHHAAGLRIEMPIDEALALVVPAAVAELEPTR